MKDTIITAKRKKTELIMLLFCFLLANAGNLYAIITYHTTISDYIAELRIAHAQRKLLTTDMSITNIAYECGFNSIARFNATFFKKIQCTPREYKKKIVK